MKSKQPERLLAKSYPRGASPPDYALLVNHTRDVVESGEAILQAIGLLAIENADLPNGLFAALGQSARLSFWLQDLGKANSHFYEMVSNDPTREQLLRHETISGLIATSEPIYSWLRSRYEPVLLQPALWAAIGHHRKFGGRHLEPRQTSKLTVWFGHPDFKIILEEMAKRLDLDIRTLGQLPEEWSIDARGGTGQVIPASGAVGNLKESLQISAEKLCNSQFDRWVGIMKAIGIAADVCASAYARKREAAGSRTITEYLSENLDQGLVPADLDQLAWRYAWEQTDDRTGPETLTGFPLNFQLHQFQREVAGLDSTALMDAYLTLAVAGCGSGKSLAAYLWARRWCQQRANAGRSDFRLIFTLPTTGTATEHFKDYALSCGVSPALKSLSHSRASVDLGFLAGDGIVQEDSRKDADRSRQAEEMLIAQADSIEALNLWTTPLIVGTADLVLGLMANARRSIVSFPAIMQAAIVFDEIHAYDDELFGHLLMFLRTFPKIPVLLMTASLPEPRLRAIREQRGDLKIVEGPPEHELRKRYSQPGLLSGSEVWTRVRDCLRDRSLGKVLWIRNQVDWANQTFRACLEELADLQPYVGIYHSRFRYRDRIEVHSEVIRRFKRKGEPCVLVATQVAEMSLNLSADLLICDLAPVPALIQRLGRLNRFATTDSGPSGQSIICEPPNPLPYTAEGLVPARSWLDRLRGVGRRLSQRDLSDQIAEDDPGDAIRLHDAWERAVFLSGRWQTLPASTRGEGNTIPVILKSDRATYPGDKIRDHAYRSAWLRNHEVSIPIRAEIQEWEVFGQTPIAPGESVWYGKIDHPEPTRRTGAEWAYHRSPTA